MAIPTSPRFATKGSVFRHGPKTDAACYGFWEHFRCGQRIVGHGVIAWMNCYWRVTGRLHFTLVALVGVGFTWSLYYWKSPSFGVPPS